MNAKKWTLLVAMITVLLATAFANDKNEKRDERRAWLDQQRSWFNENIKPKVDEQRTKFETSISDEDKKEIERLREEITSQRLIENEFIFEARAQWIKDQKVDESLQQEIESQRIVIENLYDKTKLVANRYRPEIDDVLKDLREELRSEFKDQLPEHGQRDGRRAWGRNRADGNGPALQEGPRGGRNRGFQGAYGTDRRGGRLDTVRFLLWDVNKG